MFIYTFRKIKSQSKHIFKRYLKVNISYFENILNFKSLKCITLAFSLTRELEGWRTLWDWLKLVTHPKISLFQWNQIKLLFLAKTSWSQCDQLKLSIHAKISWFQWDWLKLPSLAKISRSQCDRLKFSTHAKRGWFH